MYLVQILLPLYDNGGMPFPRNEYTRVRDELRNGSAASLPMCARRRRDCGRKHPP